MSNKKENPMLCISEKVLLDQLYDDKSFQIDLFFAPSSATTEQF